MTNIHLYARFRILVMLVAGMMVNTVMAETVPEQFDVKGFYQHVEIKRQLININDTNYTIALNLKVYKSDGKATSLLNLKSDTPVGATYAKGSSKPVIDKIWILESEEGISPPG